MGKKDDMLDDFLGDNARFADLYNGVCFDGQEIIRPEDLKLEKSISSITFFRV